MLRVFTQVEFSRIIQRLLALVSLVLSQIYSITLLQTIWAQVVAQLNGSILILVLVVAKAVLGTPLQVAILLIQGHAPNLGQSQVVTMHLAGLILTRKVELLGQVMVRQKHMISPIQQSIDIGEQPWHQQILLTHQSWVRWNIWQKEQQPPQLVLSPQQP